MMRALWNCSDSQEMTDEESLLRGDRGREVLGIVIDETEVAAANFESFLRPRRRRVHLSGNPSITPWHLVFFGHHEKKRHIDVRDARLRAERDRGVDDSLRGPILPTGAKPRPVADEPVKRSDR